MTNLAQGVFGESRFWPAAGTDRYGHDIKVDFGGVQAQAVVITAHQSQGNWGGDSYGLSEVRFGLAGVGGN